MKRYLQRFSRQRDFPLTARRRQSLDAATTHLSSFYKLCQKDMVSSRIKYSIQATKYYSPKWKIDEYENIFAILRI